MLWGPWPLECYSLFSTNPSTSLSANCACSILHTRKETSTASLASPHCNLLPPYYHVHAVKYAPCPCPTAIADPTQFLRFK
eukprot:4545824-Pleurochrysis_carterae.AAC.1